MRGALKKSDKDYSVAMISKRTFKKINHKDLHRLSTIALEDRQDLFARYPRWRKLYSKRILCIALCQGAALHYIDGKNGVKDFDVWTFYAEHPSGIPFPYRRRVRRDFGKSKFGRHPDDRQYEGRCVDLIGRSIKCSPKVNPIKALHEYLLNPKTRSAKELAKKAVVILAPNELLGKVVWP